MNIKLQEELNQKSTEIELLKTKTADITIEQHLSDLLSTLKSSQMRATEAELAAAQSQSKIEEIISTMDMDNKKLEEANV